MKPVVIAHRGASAYAPENTVPAFKKAIALGSGGIELDVHLSSDGFLVVSHDEKVDRTSSGKGLIRDKTLAELKALDFGGWFSKEFEGARIPLLDEVFELIRDWDGMLNIEIKNGPVFYPGIEKKVADAVRSFEMLERTIVSSFNHYSLVEIKRLEPALKTAPLYNEGMYEPWEYAKRIGASAIHPLFYNIVPEVMEGCIRNGIAVNPYTIDRPEDIQRVAMAKVSGIITNVPDVALQIIDGMGEGQ